MEIDSWNLIRYLLYLAGLSKQSQYLFYNVSKGGFSSHDLIDNFDLYLSSRKYLIKTAKWPYFLFLEKSLWNPAQFAGRDKEKLIQKTLLGVENYWQRQLHRGEAALYLCRREGERDHSKKAQSQYSILVKSNISSPCSKPTSLLRSEMWSWL